MQLNLEIPKIVSEIKKHKAKKVCIQLPDSLKPRAKEIEEEIRSKTDAEIIIWLGSCFGGCDIPDEIKNLDVDLLVQFGHEQWQYNPLGDN